MEQKPATRDSQHATPPHTIRLRHPWQSESHGDAIVWSRKFNWPADLPEGETVQLVVESGGAITSATLNNQSLVLDKQGRADITSFIDGHNLLSLVWPTSEQPHTDSIPLDVRLEIIGHATTE